MTYPVITAIFYAVVKGGLYFLIFHFIPHNSLFPFLSYSIYAILLMIYEIRQLIS